MFKVAEYKILDQTIKKKKKKTSSNGLCTKTYYTKDKIFELTNTELHLNVHNILN